MSRRWLREGSEQPLTLRNAIDRLFEDSFVRSGAGTGAVSFPRLDLHESDDEYVISAAIPGVTPDDVEITVDDGMVHIRGEIRRDESVEEDQYLYQERSFGHFARSIGLPAAIQPDKAEATFENGVLTLRMPKSEETKPRRIRISGGEKQAVSLEGNGDGEKKGSRQSK